MDGCNRFCGCTHLLGQNIEGGSTQAKHGYTQAKYGYTQTGTPGTACHITVLGAPTQLDFGFSAPAQGPFGGSVGLRWWWGTGGPSTTSLGAAGVCTVWFGDAVGAPTQLDFGFSAPAQGPFGGSVGLRWWWGTGGPSTTSLGAAGARTVWFGDAVGAPTQLDFGFSAPAQGPFGGSVGLRWWWGTGGPSTTSLGAAGARTVWFGDAVGAPTQLDFGFSVPAGGPFGGLVGLR
ncbi:hypothetical protein C8J57DRAFT_1515585 [Mycena rebaudengoi]|nr:hypothetical protein C8J57DRAFT_1515585 [Mycena rebaudengoi]